MNKVTRLIKKDIKLLLRSKTSSLIVIFGPLLVMLLVGTAFDNTSRYNINIGVYSGSYSDLTESFIDKLIQEKYTVQRFDSELMCIESIKQGSIHSCIVFPPDLKIEEGKTAEITFHIDYSKVNLVWMVLDSLSSRLRARSSEISMDLTEALLERIELAKTEVTKDLNIADELKTRNAKIDSNIKQINSNINSIQINLNELDGPLISDSATGIYESAVSFKNDTYARLEDIEDNLNTIISKAGSFGNDSKAESIISRASDSKGEIRGIRYRLDKAMNSTDAHWDNIAPQLRALKVNLEKISSWAGSIESGSSSIKSDIAAAISSTDDLQVSLTNLQSSLGSIRITDAQKIAAPITTKIEPVTVEKTHLNYLFSTLLVLVIMFISLLLATTIVMMERTSPSYFRNFITPTRSRVFIFSTYLTTALIVGVQLVIILLISAIFFKATLFQNMHYILLSLLLVISCFSLLGMLVGYLFNSQETAIIGSISLGSLCLLLSSTILPLESMPKYMMQIAKYNPFVISDTLLKKVILFQQGFTAIGTEVGVLLSYSLLLLAVIFAAQKHSKIKSIIPERHKERKVSDIDKAILEIKAALKKKDKAKAKDMFEKARLIYHQLRDSKSPAAKKAYKRLQKLYPKVK